MCEDADSCTDLIVCVASSDLTPRTIWSRNVADEQVIQLLEEIRDLQKLHLENYKDALKNQRESMDVQKKAVRRQKIALLVAGCLLLAFLIFMAWSSHPTAG